VSKDILVFLGPTLPHAEAAAHLTATYLPPAEQGSFVKAVRHLRPGAIVLIDGVFGAVPAVRHKEILWTLARGIPVFGAASMGALRAAELAPVGMQGYGFIYRWYALTPLADDDEVAVAMTPSELGGQPLSEALINIRLTLRLAARQSILSQAERRALEAIARSMHFVERTYPALLARARANLQMEEALHRFEQWRPAHAIDQKRTDAVSLLTHLAHAPHRLRSPGTATRFRMTEAWAHDLEVAGLFSEDITELERS
jgi:hypothetical protein